MGPSLLARLFARAAQAVDWSVGWTKLPPVLGVITLLGLRITMRQRNLYDTSTRGSTPAPPAPDGDRYLTARSADGGYNDLGQPAMGSAGTRFGRNVPLNQTYPDSERPDGAVVPHTVDPNVNLSLGSGLPGYTWDILPGDPTGQYTINATEGEASGTGAFTVTTPPAGTRPKILVVPRVSSPGATIKIGLSGFQPGQTVHLYLYRDTLNGDGTKRWEYVTELATVQTEAQGQTAGQAIYSLPTQPDDYAMPGPSNGAPNNYLILTDPSTLIPNADFGTWQTRFAAFCLSGLDPTNSGCDDAGYLLPTAITGS
jgi:hypothetical protein